MTGLAPLGAAPLGGWWTPVEPPTSVTLPSAIIGGDVVWLVEIGQAAAGTGTPAPAPPGMLGGVLGDPAQPADIASTAPTVLASDRGWLGEPGDGTRPNAWYPPRLVEPVALESSLPVLPEDTRRAAFTAGELRLGNADGALDALASDWAIGGRAVRLLRGPHARPRHADYAAMLAVANLRAAGAASGTTRLSIPLSDAGADLSVPACATYGGTGGADGVASLAGQPKPLLLGYRRFIEPVLEDPARLIYRVHHGAAISAIVAVRDRGVSLTANANVANYAALQAASPGAGTYTPCLAEGCIRLGATPSLVTVDARGDAGGAGYSSGTPASLATKLITGPGGIPATMIAPNAFGDWPVAEAGLAIRGGTVAQALDAVAAGVAGWWGVTRLGLFTGGRIAAPETLTPDWDIQPWMLRQPPAEAGVPDPPRWRATVGYQVLGRVMTGEDLAGSVSAANRELWGKPWQTAVAADNAVIADYPLARDPAVLPSILDASADAQTLAAYLLALHRVPRRTWRVPLNRAGLALDVGRAVKLTWPRHGLALGRVLLVRAISLRGDTTEILLWG
jgi:hypothetical protein